VTAPVGLLWTLIERLHAVQRYTHWIANDTDPVFLHNTYSRSEPDPDGLWVSYADVEKLLEALKALPPAPPQWQKRIQDIRQRWRHGGSVVGVPRSVIFQQALQDIEVLLDALAASPPAQAQEPHE